MDSITKSKMTVLINKRISGRAPIPLSGRMVKKWKPGRCNIAFLVRLSVKNSYENMNPK